MQHGATSNVVSRLISLFFLCFLSGTAGAQGAMTAPGSEPGAGSLKVHRVNDEITLDGYLHEEVWQSSGSAQHFWQVFPVDTIRSPLETKVWMAYDDRYLYVAARCESLGEDYIVPSLRRDYDAGGNDNLTFIFDTFSDKTNAQVFGINPYGVLREALIFNGGQSGGDWDESWDNKWKGKAQIQEGYWTCELAIPFSTLRFKKGSKSWNFNAYRFDMQSNTRSSWQRVPLNQSIISLAYTGPMEWEGAPEPVGKGITLIPYVAGDINQDYEAGDKRANLSGSVGGDAKIAITPGLNLDLTANPDFSQVEVDRQVINLERFEVFFPERRQFFLENADLFSGFGFRDANPFFSRRIGIGRDTTTGLAISIPIFGGARLSGKLDQNWRIGALSMQTARNMDNGLPSYNYSVGAVQRRVGSRSNLGLIFVNKQAINYESEQSSEYSRYNRVVGFDYNLATNNNRWTGKTYIHGSFSPGDARPGISHGAELEYRVRSFSASWGHQWVTDDFNAEVGFVPRRDYAAFEPRFQWFMYPTNGPINQHGPGIVTNLVYRPELGLTDRSTRLYWDFNWKAGGGAFASLDNEYIFLTRPFDPTRTGATPLPADTGYTFTSVRLFFRNPPQRKIHYRLSANAGQFFNGQRYGATAEITWRYQPLGFITLDARYQYITLPEPYASAGLFLIGPRIDLTFTRNIFLTTFVQYNSQARNLNINARFQWRYAPVSDFFLVYTDNYGTEFFNVRNRAIVAKLTYWLNL